MTIRERLDAVRQQEHVSVNELALLTALSERTIWRRLHAGVFPVVLRSGRVVRIHRVSALRVLRQFEPTRHFPSTAVNTAPSATECHRVTA
jgi:predicted DNA-binding transcriptional regulator AlpA